MGLLIETGGELLARRLAEALGLEVLRQYSHSDLDDPSQFDFVVNTGVQGLDGALASVSGAFSALAGAARSKPDSWSPRATS